MIQTSSHPEWVEDFLNFIEPYQYKVVNSKIFRDMSEGTLELKRFQGGLINFYPLVENFPLYMALNLAKVPAGNCERNKRTRYWLITNINQERLHTVWWKQWAMGFGVPKETFNKEIYPPSEMDAINNYLWRICTRGSLAEGISAANFAIEGATGGWTREVNKSLKKYKRVKDAQINEKTLRWVTAHASYDDRHPEEALEIIKTYATTKEEQEKVKRAAKRSLEYYALALDACYEIFGR
jgi:pyrroloquinoline quinone (PQQ) biosynthesis protein C